MVAQVQDPSLCSGDFFFTGQQLTSPFGVACTSIRGDLTIDAANIQDLSDLSLVTVVENVLRITNVNLFKDLTGLANLKTIGSLIVSDNLGLENLNGLEGINSSLNSITIIGNKSLRNIDALNHVKTVYGNVRIASNLVLKNLHGLSSVTTITEGGELYINDNTQLTSLNGLIALESVNSGIFIDKNPNLLSISGLSSLRSVGRNEIGISVQITGNKKIIDYCVFRSLVSAAGFEIAVLAGSPVPGLTSINPTQAELQECSKTSICTGDIHLSSSTTDDDKPVQNVNGEPCSVIKGSLFIEETLFTKVDALLIRVQEITGDLIIRENSALSHLDGLSSLARLRGNLVLIHGNEVLANIDGLSGIVVPHGSSTAAPVTEVVIDSNPSLSTVQGLASIVHGSYLGSLRITNCPTITNLQGLESMITIKNSLTLCDNDGMLDLMGLSGISSIEGSLSICRNKSLSDLNGLAALTRVGDYVFIDSNGSLVKIGDGFTRLEEIGGKFVVIRNNLELILNHPTVCVFPNLTVAGSSSINIVAIDTNNPEGGSTGISSVSQLRSCGLF